MWGKATKPEERRKGLQALLCSSAEMALLTPLGPGTAPSAQHPVLAAARWEQLRDLLLGQGESG